MLYLMGSHLPIDAERVACVPDAEQMAFRSTSAIPPNVRCSQCVSGGVRPPSPCTPSLWGHRPKVLCTSVRARVRDRTPPS